MQPQGHVQVLTGLLDEELNAQQVLDRSRFRVTGGFSAFEDDEAGDVVRVEEGDEDAPVWQGLRDKGHEVKVERDSLVVSYFGRGSVVIREGEVVSAGCERRRADGSAMSLV